MRRYWKELDQNETSVLSQPSFFTTDRGKQAIYHALEIAKCHLAYSARAMTLSFKAPFEVVRKLTCDHQVTIKSKRLPNGQATGKVKSLTLMADGSTGSAWGEVQLACSIGKEEKNQKEAPYVNPYVAKEYCTHDYILNHQNRHQTPSSIHLKEFQHHLPTQGILHKLSRDELVQDINLENDATSQNNALSQYELISPIQLAEVLNQNPTTLKIALKNLRTTGTLAHTINLKITKGYTPPLQINLS